MSKHIVWHHSMVTRHHRELLNRHKAIVVWFTGLSGAGKSTLAHALEQKLYQMSCRTYVYDGDNVRHGLCGDLTFTAEDRSENIRRIGEMARLSVDAGVITLAAFISPIKRDRDRIRALFSAEDFIEVYCRCPLTICEQRDVKGMYKRARAGEITDFTGISSPYDEPLEAELVIDTDQLSIEDSVEKIIRAMGERGVFRLGE